jgi:hypothetical protein
MRLELTLRADLPAAEEAAECAEVIAGHLSRVGATSVVYIMYAAEANADLGALIDALERSTGAAGVDVWDMLHVAGGVWRSLLCVDTDCCPPGGTPLGSGSPGVAEVEAVAAGMSALPSRQALVDTLKPVDRAAIAAVGVEISILAARPWSLSRSAIAGRRATTVRMVAQVLDARTGPLDTRTDCAAGPGGSADGTVERQVRRVGRVRARDGDPLRAPDVARILVGLADPQAVDRCCQLAVGPSGPAAVSLWTELVRLSPPSYAAAPASILSYAAWRHGLGSLANIAVERALAGDPAYPLACLMHEILLHGLDPRSLDRPSDKAW